MLTTRLTKQAVLHRVFGNEANLTELSELGVLFLLFEMGLELNIDRLTVSAGVCVV